METSRQKIKALYEMLFPYGEYNEDAAFACIAINRELKNLCKNNMRHILLIIARYLGHKFTPNTPTNDICKIIQDGILSICLGLGLSDEEKANIITGLKTGVTRPLTNIQIGCQNYRDRFYNPLFALATISSNRIWEMLYEYLTTKDEDVTDEEDSFGPGPRIYLFEGWQNILALLRQGRFLEVFKMGLQENGMINLGHSSKRYPLTNQDVELFNYIIEGFLSGKYNIETTTWNDVCK